MLLAQNRGLATNLHRYQRRIADLETALRSSESERRGATDALSVVHRRIANFEDDIATLRGSVSFERQSRQAGASQLQ